MGECESNCKTVHYHWNRDTNKRMMRVGSGQVMKDFVCLNNREGAPYSMKEVELLKDSKPHTKTISMERGRGGMVGR